MVQKLHCVGPHSPATSTLSPITAFQYQPSIFLNSPYDRRENKTNNFFLQLFF